MNTQAWFEMTEIRRRKYERSAWVPLQVEIEIDKSQPGTNGYIEEYFGLGSVAVPVEQRKATEQIGWNEIGIRNNSGGWLMDGTYIPSSSFVAEDITGEFLVLNQRFNAIDCNEWHLSQDLVLTLGLKREGDVWVRPAEGYVAVAKLERRLDNSPRELSVRATHLRDYLCGCGKALYLTSYRSRTEITRTADHIDWEGMTSQSLDGLGQWEGRVMAIHEGGMPYGRGYSVMHVARTDIDPEEDAPSMGFPTDKNVETVQWTSEFKGEKLFRITGELWRNEWIEPATQSPISRGDEVSATEYFIVDIEGTRESRETLVDGESRWLWFRPGVMVELLSWRNSSLVWYTMETGGISCTPGKKVHFGVNAIGLINVYAKDIGLLPDWQQQIWAGYNLSPEGKVSLELLSSQMMTRPAGTRAPEADLRPRLSRINELSTLLYGVNFIDEHEKSNELHARIHRFRATDRDGLLALAKDLARATSDCLNISCLQGALTTPGTEKLGTLKSLERVLATLVSADKARELMGPLHGMYQLRLADAHMPGENLESSFKLANVDTNQPFVIQGFQLIKACVDCFGTICQVFQTEAEISNVK